MAYFFDTYAIVEIIHVNPDYIYQGKPGDDPYKADFFVLFDQKVLVELGLVPASMRYSFRMIGNNCTVFVASTPETDKLFDKVASSYRMGDAAPCFGGLEKHVTGGYCL